MDNEVKNKLSLKEIFKLISTIISWTVFVLLLICAAFLLYYFIATKVYVAKGTGYEPKFSLYTIVSPSMVPNINVYDVVIDVKLEKPEDVKINDVITFNSSIPGVEGGTITHRVIAISKDKEGNYYYKTKGDNNLVDDGVDVSFNSIVGKVALRIPGLGKVQSFMASSMGWLMFILVPALYIIIKDILRIIKNKKEEKEEKLKIKNILFNSEKKLLPYTPKIVSEPNNLTFMDDDDDVDIDDLPTLK